MTANGYQEWIGRTQSAAQEIIDAPVSAMCATLGNHAPELSKKDQIPPLWHWLYFLECAPWHQLAQDGHQKRGEFLPPIDLPRRMWAGSKVDFHAPLFTGTRGRRESKINAVENKEGRSGKLAFVTVVHEIYCDEQLAISEIQNIVYREAPTNTVAPSGKPAPDSADFQETVVPDPLLLFRYSALTFNAHRIHYDRPYAMETEGYPGLVVHGPLLATLMTNLLAKHYPDGRLRNFEFRALKPVFDLAPFTVCGNVPDESGETALWIADKDQEICMSASAKLDL